MKIATFILVSICIAATLMVGGCSWGGRDDPEPPAAAPWDFDLYLVGEFSGWGREEKYKMQWRDGAYHLDNLPFNSGMPPFKVAGPEWTTYPDFSADTTRETTILPGTSYAMFYRNGGQNNRLAVARKGLFDITVVVTEADLAEPAISFTVAADEPVFEPTLYLKGIGGNLQDARVLRYQGDGLYILVTQLPAGDKRLLLASDNDALAFSAAAAAIGQTALARCDSACQPASLSIAEAGYYRFVVDARDHPDAPMLTISKAQEEDMTLISPHEGHEQLTRQVWPTWKAGQTETATFSVKQAAAALREYAQSSTQELRDPGDNHVRYSEAADLPKSRSGNLVFDALFALAMHEMRQNSVSDIRDGSYNSGAAIACECFETGAKWHYVWTRDLAYATHLGLGMLDPQRARRSLEFKVSGFRDSLQAGLNPAISRIGQGRQIVQDTGTGGSWPASSDRVAWALGAEQTLAALPPAERAQFLPLVYEALANTAENDRLANFDAGDGLYAGEQSFLDWREQTYARWIVDDLTHLASSKALSTNVVHYMALSLAARLAGELGHTGAASRYGQWAAALKLAINQKLWLPEAGLYASMTGGDLDPAPVHRFDLLGEALAVISGVADASQAASIVSRYPIGPFGSPVYFPQQPGVAVYHNRAIWPFVSAYGLRAAAQVGNVAAVNAHMDTLMRGAALNLSNMENLEWLSGQPGLLDLQHPELTGPVINSQRQLWSVGAYASLVMNTAFGFQIADDGLRIQPFVTAHLHQLLGGQRSATLENLNFRGKKITLRLSFPESAASDGYYPLQGLSLNGSTVSGVISEGQLLADNVIEISLGTALSDDQTVARISGIDPLAIDDARVFAPHEPKIEHLTLLGGKLQLDFSDRLNSGVTWTVYRNGTAAAQGLTADGLWNDNIAVEDGRAYCYSVEAVATASGHRSQRSAPLCYGTVDTVPVSDARVQHGGNITPADAQIAEPSLRDWGAPDDVLAVQPLTLAGHYAIRLRYSNIQHAINLGISNGVKEIRVLRAGVLIASGIVQMPHVQQQGTAHVLRESTALQVDLPAGDYAIEVHDFYNMSYLAANASYNDAGGRDGPVNRVHLTALTLSRR